MVLNRDYLAALLLTAIGVVVCLASVQVQGDLFSGAYRVDLFSQVFKVILSMGLLLVTFLGMTWVAAKIYRTGILMYGKRISYRELWKWIRYS